MEESTVEREQEKSLTGKSIDTTLLPWEKEGLQKQVRGDAS
jgi:hypothetical protein